MFKPHCLDKANTIARIIDSRDEPMKIKKPISSKKSYVFGRAKQGGKF
jgi:hypothetical protein